MGVFAKVESMHPPPPPPPGRTCRCSYSSFLARRRQEHTTNSSYGPSAFSADNAPTPSRRYHAKALRRPSVKKTPPLCGGRTAAANPLLSDIWNDGWWGEQGTRSTRKQQDPNIYQTTSGFFKPPTRRGVLPKASPLLFGAETVLRRRAAKKSGEWSGGRRSGGLFHGKAA